MPKQITETCPTTLHTLRRLLNKGACRIRQFLQIARRKDARSVKIKKNGTQTKFKIRCSKYLYTLIMSDKGKACHVRCKLEGRKRYRPPRIDARKKAETQRKTCSRRRWIGLAQVGYGWPR
ncbi:unnamed protein product [Effrenium voratum]|nr:unnamed protein product [Effrenium voratum]